MLGFVLAAANAVGAVKGAVSGGGGLSSKDQARVNAANSALTKALNGDASALAYMIQQSNNSATQVGKDAFRQALQIYYREQTGGGSGASSSTVGAGLTSAQTPLQLQVTDTTQKVRDDIAQGIQNIGSGATNAATNKVSGRTTAFTLPTDTRSLFIIGASAIGAFLIFRKHH